MTLSFRLVFAVGLAASNAGGAPALEKPIDPGHITVLVINGGGSDATNYQSHLLHVEQLLEVLRSSGVSDKRITILSGDGADPDADLALREVQPEADFWLVVGSRLERLLRTPVTYQNSAVSGIELRPAVRTEVERWFARVGSRLKGGDTLLLYVTDHGTRNQKDSRDNRITLWGKGESLSVNELHALVAKLDPEARVVMAMSQCYSGSFANLIRPVGAMLPRGNVCGYFSTTAERPAYGCYPENRGVDNVGHGFLFIQGLAERRNLGGAHAQVMQNDATPDVPLRTSDFYLEELLRERATETGKSFEALVDELLAEAWRDKASWEPEIRLLDAIGRNFGSFSPRSLAELSEQTSRLGEISEQLDTHAKAWKSVIATANAANVDRFLLKQPAWGERLAPERLDEVATGSIRELAGGFLAELAESTYGDEATSARLETLRRKSETSASVSYRMEVRLGVVLRLRAILVSVAGRQYLSRRGTTGQRNAFGALEQCEDLALPAPAKPLRRTITEMAPFPPLEDELKLARDVVPAWIGIRFGAIDEARRAALGLTRGAAIVQAVYPQSPAEAAGLQVGDLITGPPDSPFQEPGQIREWTMLAEIDRPVSLDLLRDRDSLTVSLVPGSRPVKWPELSGPPKVSEAAPAFDQLKLMAYRGDAPRDRAGRTGHLLFFWATWCGPCKAALPELLAFERVRGVPVIAITDESAATLEPFFKAFVEPFPERVSIDAARRAFRAYGVSGTPTFVLVDGAGTVRSYSTGYNKTKGIGIGDWKWPQPAGQ